jgi:hypothetical protein
MDEGGGGGGGNGSGRHTIAPPKPDVERREATPPRRVRRARHGFPSASRFGRGLSVAAIALALGGGALLGTYVLKKSPIAEHAQHATVGVRDAQGHIHLWGKILPPPTGKIYWGAFRLNAPYDTKLVSGLESEVGRRPAVLMWYQEWNGEPAFPVDEAAYLFDRGIVPMVTWEPWKPPSVFGDLVNDQPRFSLKRIVDGAWDPYITRYAREIEEYGGPVMLRPMHEMDGFWYPWSGTVQKSAGNSPVEYIRAWRHIWRIFRDVGASNVTWVWSVNHVSVPDTSANQIDNYWPGKKYVDWIGFSGFNWGTASPASIWKGFDSVELDRYKQILRWNRPIALTEMGAPEVGGDKATWIKDSFKEIFDHYPQMKLVIWYDKQDSPERQWQIDSSPQSLQAFKDVIADPRVLEASAALVTAAPHVRER